MAKIDYSWVNPSNFGGAWNDAWGQVGANATRMMTGGNQNQAVMNASQRAGISPEQQAGLLQGVKYNDLSNINLMPPMSSGGANAYVNPQATKQVAQGINQGYSMLGTGQQGDWWSQLGGYFQDRPAFTQGLMTSGIGLLAGQDLLTSAGLGGQSMEARQTQITQGLNTAREAKIKEQEMAVNEILAQAKIYEAIGGMLGKEVEGGTQLSKATEMAKKYGLEGGELQKAVTFYMQSGKMPPVKTKHTIQGKPYQVVDMNI